jgi:hypothetical protein
VSAALIETAEGNTTHLTAVECDRLSVLASDEAGVMLHRSIGFGVVAQRAAAMQRNATAAARWVDIAEVFASACRAARS